MDKRWKQLAELLVTYSAEVQPGERVMIAMLEPETYPLTEALYEAVIKAGGYPQVQFKSERLRHLMMKYGNAEQVGWVPEIEAYGMEWADVYFGLRGAHNLHVHWDIPDDVLSRNQMAHGKVSTLRWEKTRWCLVRVPNEAFAQQAEVDLETVTDMFFDACFLDWPARAARWQQWAEQLNTASQVRVLGTKTDLSFSVEGRTWIVADGKINMPDGEIYTSPVTASLDGQICFEFPGVLGGRLVPDICLRWEQGKLVHASASANEDFLRAVLNTDEGASLVGEFGIGTNPHIDIFSKDILLDEKIGGTVHIALGRAYASSGGKNQSAIHWDIIKDIREEGAVVVDGQVVLENGEFHFD